MSWADLGLFLITGATLVIAGVVLTRAADTVAELTGWGKLTIGIVLLATVTSLPELATDIAAVRLGAPNLAAGDLFGSSMANMLILALIGLVPTRDHSLPQATLDHALAAALAISLNGIAAVFILAPTGLALFGIGPEPVTLALVFGFGTAAVCRHGRQARVLPTAVPKPPPASVRPAGKANAGLWRVIGRFAAAAIVIVAVAPIFAHTAQRIAELTGLGNTFVGTWLVGLATSLPELATCIAAVRLGAFDLAIGNLFGSNAFNMVVFAPLEFVAGGPPLFSTLDPGHGLTALFSTILMSLGLVATILRARRRVAWVEPGSLLMVACYFLALWALYTRIP